jgi:hypothetical protein
MLSSSATKTYNSPVDLENLPHQPFTHDGLIAYVDVIQITRKTSRTMDGKELTVGSEEAHELDDDLKRWVSLLLFL